MQEKIDYLTAFKLARATASRHGMNREDAEDFAAEEALNHNDENFKIRLNRRFIDWFRSEFGDRRSKTTGKRPREPLEFKWYHSRECTIHFDLVRLPKNKSDSIMFILKHVGDWKQSEIAREFGIAEETVCIRMKAYEKLIVQLHSDPSDV